jgi:hypothetical protein
MAEPLTSARDAVVGVLRSGPRRARLVAEVSGALRRANVSPAEVEHALDELASEGAVLLRSNYCEDPHMEGIDLRIVRLVDRAQPDPEGAALTEIEATWQRWLGEYLANHRCS